MMEYNQKTILILLQDLQRRYLGNATMTLTCTTEGVVFDVNGEMFLFPNDDTEESKKMTYIEVLNLLKTT